MWYDPNSGMPFTNQDIPQLLVLLGENELLFRFLARQAPGSFPTISWALLMPLMDPARCDPRFQDPLSNAGLKDLRAASLCKVPK